MKKKTANKPSVTNASKPQVSMQSSKKTEPNLKKKPTKKMLAEMQLVLENGAASVAQAEKSGIQLYNKFDIDHDVTHGEDGMTLIYSETPNIDRISADGAVGRYVNKSDIDAIMAHSAEVAKMTVPGQILESDKLAELDKTVDWDDIPTYVVDLFTKWTNKSSLESTIDVGKQLTVTYLTPTSETRATINIGENLKYNGELLQVNSKFTAIGTYNIMASFDRNGLMKHKNARTLYNYILSNVNKK